MSLTYERPSTRTLNGRSPRTTIASTSGFNAPIAPASSIGSYTSAELTARAGVPHAALAMLAASRTGCEQCEQCAHRPEQCCEHYVAIDVVRLAVLDRLMRFGVPMARAAALVRAAETLANTVI